MTSFLTDQIQSKKTPTIHPLLVLHHRINELLDKQQEGRVVALDISGAFDCVCGTKDCCRKSRHAGFAGEHWPGSTTTWLTAARWLQSRMHYPTPYRLRPGSHRAPSSVPCYSVSTSMTSPTRCDAFHWCTRGFQAESKP